MQDNHFLNEALRYAAMGWSVIPLRVKDKKPAISKQNGGWEPYQEQRADEEQIRQWWGRFPQANVGIVTGSISGIIVLDVDGPEGRASLEKITERFGVLPATPESTTGKGSHYIFKHPGGDLRNFAKKGINLDFRGDGGYIVAPPSVHPNGGVYRWEQDPEQVALADPPDWLLELLKNDQAPSWFHEMFPPPKSTRQTGERKAVSGQAGNGQADTILRNCAFCQHCKGTAETLSEPEWYAMISNLARADSGPDLIHELSKPHPGYRERDTEQKIEHALQDGEPHTCQYIQQNLGFTGCPDGGCGVKAPIGFVTSPVVMAKLQVESCIISLKDEAKREKVFDDEVIGALAVLRQRDTTEYIKAKGTIKDLCGKLVSLNDLEKAVKERQVREGHLKIVREQEPESLPAEWMADAPMEKAIKPRGYKIGEHGITTVEWKGDSTEEITVFPAPVLLSKRFRSIDDGREKVELAYRWDGEWNRLVVDADIPFTASKIVTLRKDGFPVSSETAKYLVKYLDAFVAANKETIPIQRSVAHMGWIGSRHFLPGLEGDIHLDVEPGGTAGVAAGYRQEGTLEEWIKFIEPVRMHPIARFTIAAAFAGPLMSLVNQRVFIIHNWGPSRGGKTATLKAALSVWGEPETIMASFNSTKVGLERLAGFYSDLPLGIDERQVVGDKQGFVESLVYMLGLGKGKARGAKGGGLQAFQSWRTIALTTGEEPLSSESSTAGIKTRALEINGLPIEDEKLARTIHQGIAENYGMAGPMFVKRIMEELDKDPNYFKEDYANMMREWEERNIDALGSHLSALTTVMMADFYASKWIFGMDEVAAMKEAKELADTILGKLDTGQSTDDAVRAMEYLASWYHVNQLNFGSSPTIQWYGMWTQDGIAIFPTAFEKAMKDGGFNSRRILSDWSDRGWIESEVYPGDNKRRNKIRRQINGRRYQVILVRHDTMRDLEERMDEEMQLT
ncbi:DUF927 domain-containing protein [Brevibacillus porteri]|nr:DUF927 domain-containing protein [Brevibacillus porteri]MED1801819.1 DUF927 domain-containing protein [Brevibacillus porteri]MED2134950.1 DUF927 domain-containing protein [Brevibacillus porteri]MED2745472.1 DUF927 domain-containing protein [Brevibacillus porteri]MED2815782.1 DUF927 domain-containing protein [Brevibacillus porteri]MED2897620.1 DUF927 domain-containing protein [Brevibacillus porteri]